MVSREDHKVHRLAPDRGKLNSQVEGLLRPEIQLALASSRKDNKRANQRVLGLDQMMDVTDRMAVIGIPWELDPPHAIHQDPDQDPMD
jgi:hypothetical protein